MARQFIQRLRANISSTFDLCGATISNALLVFDSDLGHYTIYQPLTSNVSIVNAKYPSGQDVIASDEAFTIAFWLQVESTYTNSNGTKEVYIASSDTEQCIKLHTDVDNALYLSIFDTYNNKDFVKWKISNSNGLQLLSTGKFHTKTNHFMITRESVFLHLYVNGEYIDDIEVGDSAEFPIHYFDTIGKFTASNNIKVSSCYIDDFVVFNGAYRTKEMNIEVPNTYLDLYASYIDKNTVFVAHFDDSSDVMKFITAKSSLFNSGELSFTTSNSEDVGLSDDTAITSIHTPGEGGSLTSLNSLNDFISLCSTQLWDEVTYDFKFKVKTDSSSSTIDPFDSSLINYVIADPGDSTTVIAIKPTNDTKELIIGAKAYDDSSTQTVIPNTTIETDHSTRQWNHCAITIKKESDSTRTVSIFMNGKMVFSVDNILSTDDIPSIDFHFGLSNSDSMTSLIDELRVSNVVRYDSTGFTPESSNYDLDYPILLDGETNDWLDDSNIGPGNSNNDTTFNVKANRDTSFDTLLTLSNVNSYVTIPYGMYAIVDEGDAAEFEFDTNLIVRKDFTVNGDTERTVYVGIDELSDTERTVLRELTEDFDTKLDIEKNISEYFDTEHTVYIGVDELSDTERTVLKDLAEDFDTEREVEKDISDNFDTERNVEKDVDGSFGFDTERNVLKDIDDDFDTEREVEKNISDNFDTELIIGGSDDVIVRFDTKFEVKKDIDEDSDTLYKVVKDNTDDFDTIETVIKSITIESDTKRTVYSLVQTSADTRLMIIKDGEPIPVDDVKAKKIRTVGIARNGSVNFRCQTGDSHHYYWVSAELIKTMLERNYIVYEQSATEGEPDIILTLDNYDKPTGGYVITDDQIPGLSVVPNIELEVSRTHDAEKEEFLRRKGMNIKAQQDKLINS